MISRKLLRDVSLAVLLALPTLSLTRPVASHAQATDAAATPLAEQTKKIAMTTAERRSQIPQH